MNIGELLTKLEDKEYLVNVEKLYIEHEGNLFYAVCILKDGCKERELIYEALNPNHRIDDIEAQMKEWNIDINNPSKSFYNFSMRAMHINSDID